MGLNSIQKKREKSKSKKEDVFIKKTKSKGKTHSHNAKLSAILRRRLIQNLRSKNIHKIDGRHVNLCKTKELATSYFEAYNFTQDQKDDFHRKLGLKENYFDSRYEDHKVYVYFIGNTEEGYVKIGYSNNPEKRLRSIQVGCPFVVGVLGVVEGDKEVEQGLHKKFNRYKTIGEWFRYEGEIKEYIEDFIE